MATTQLRRFGLRRDLQLVAALTLAQLLLLGLYFAATDTRTGELRYALYPFVWINVGLLALYHVDVPDTTRRYHVLSASIAAVYFLVLLYLSGLIGLNPEEGLVAASSGLTVEPGSPGWERLYVVTPSFYITFLTYRIFGFLVLSYLVYVTLLEASGSILGGAFGLFACVGCTFPIFTSLAAGAFGSTAIAGAVYGFSIDISTAVFVLAVGLLYWRPGLDTGGDA